MTGLLIFSHFVFVVDLLNHVNMSFPINILSPWYIMRVAHVASATSQVCMVLNHPSPGISILKDSHIVMSQQPLMMDIVYLHFSHFFYKN